MAGSAGARDTAAKLLCYDSGAYGTNQSQVTAPAGYGRQAVPLDSARRA
jgi:hypothetical protein